MLKTKNVNFKGAFRIGPSELKAQNDIPKLFTQGRQIFSNIKENGDQFIVIRDNYDKRIGNYIKENQVNNIEYYPKINTKCRLDSEKPQEVVELLKTIRPVIDLDEMFVIIAKQKRVSKSIDAKSEVEKIANALRLNIENSCITSDKHSTIVRDESKKRTIEIIAMGKANSYVCVQPDSISEGMRLCIVDGKGAIVKDFVTPSEIHKFFKIFKKLKNENKNLLVSK